MNRFRKWLRKFLQDKRAISMRWVVLGIVSLFLIAILGPEAIGTIANANTANWNSAVVTVFQILLPVLAVVGFAIAYIPKVGKGK